MKSIEELLKCGLNEFWDECSFYNLSKVELFNYIRITTNNFELRSLKLFIEDLDFLSRTLRINVTKSEKGGPLLPVYSSFDLDELLADYLLKIEINGDDNPDLLELYNSNDLKSKLDFIDKEFNCYPDDIQLNLYYIAHTEYKRITESTDHESLNSNKIKLNRRQKIALLESVGVLKFLEINVFSGNQTQMAKFLCLIIDYDQQNIRKDITKDTETLLYDTKIVDIINPILYDLGLKNKE